MNKVKCSQCPLAMDTVFDGEHILCEVDDTEKEFDHSCREQEVWWWIRHLDAVKKFSVK